MSHDDSARSPGPIPAPRKPRVPRSRTQSNPPQPGSSPLVEKGKFGQDGKAWSDQHMYIGQSVEDSKRRLCGDNQQSPQARQGSTFSQSDSIPENDEDDAFLYTGDAPPVNDQSHPDDSISSGTENMTASLETLKARKEELEGGVVRGEGRVEELRAQEAELRRRIDTLKEEEKGLKEEVGRHKSTVASLRQDESHLSQIIRQHQEAEADRLRREQELGEREQALRRKESELVDREEQFDSAMREREYQVKTEESRLQAVSDELLARKKGLDHREFELLNTDTVTETEGRAELAEKQRVLQRSEDELQQRRFEIVQEETRLSEWARHLQEREAVLRQRSQGVREHEITLSQQYPQHHHHYGNIPGPSRAPFPAPPQPRPPHYDPGSRQPPWAVASGGVPHGGKRVAGHGAGQEWDEGWERGRIYPPHQHGIPPGPGNLPHPHGQPQYPSIPDPVPVPTWLPQAHTGYPSRPREPQASPVHYPAPGPPQGVPPIHAQVPRHEETQRAYVPSAAAEPSGRGASGYSVQSPLPSSQKATIDVDQEIIRAMISEGGLESLQLKEDEEFARKLQEEENERVAQLAGERPTVNMDHDQQLAILLQEGELAGGMDDMTITNDLSSQDGDKDDLKTRLTRVMGKKEQEEHDSEMARRLAGDQMNDLGGKPSQLNDLDTP